MIRKLDDKTAHNDDFAYMILRPENKFSSKVNNILIGMLAMLLHTHLKALKKKSKFHDLCKIMTRFDYWNKIKTNTIVNYELINLVHCLTELTHWGQVTHICICKLTITGSGLPPDRHQAIVWASAGILGPSEQASVKS